MGVSVNSFLMLGIKITLKDITVEALGVRYDPITGVPKTLKIQHTRWAAFYREQEVASREGHEELYSFIRSYENETWDSYDFNAYDFSDEIVIGKEYFEVGKDHPCEEIPNFSFVDDGYQLKRLFKQHLGIENAELKLFNCLRFC